MTAIATADAHRSAGRRARGHYTTREAWLQAAIDLAFRPWIAAHGYEVAQVLISVGYAPGQRAGGSVRATCFHSSVSGGLNTIFVSPEVDDLPQVLATVLHELGHHVLDNEDGHRGRFATLMGALGFTASFTDSGNRTPELQGLLEQLAADLGPYGGHVRFDLAKGRTVRARPTGHAGQVAPAPVAVHKPRERNRWLKAECTQVGCEAAEGGYKARLSRGQVEAFGAPLCPACREQMTYEQ